MDVSTFFNVDEDLSCHDAQSVIKLLSEREFVMYYISVMYRDTEVWLNDVYLFDGFTYWNSDMYGVPSEGVENVMIINVGNYGK
jgi:hypothetical protein